MSSTVTIQQIPSALGRRVEVNEDESIRIQEVLQSVIFGVPVARGRSTSGVIEDDVLGIRYPRAPLDPPSGVDTGSEYLSVAAFAANSHVDTSMMPRDAKNRPPTAWAGIRMIPSFIRNSLSVPQDVPQGLIDDATFSDAEGSGHVMLNYAKGSQPYYMSEVVSQSVKKGPNQACGSFDMAFTSSHPVPADVTVTKVSPDPIVLTDPVTIECTPIVYIPDDVTLGAHFEKMMAKLANHTGMEPMDWRTAILSGLRSTREHSCQGGRAFVSSTTLYRAPKRIGRQPTDIEGKNLILRLSTDMSFDVGEQGIVEGTQVDVRIVAEYLCHGFEDPAPILNSFVTVILRGFNSGRGHDVRLTGLSRASTHRNLQVAGLTDIRITPEGFITGVLENLDSLPPRYGVVYDPRSTELAPSQLAFSINVEVVYSNQWAGLSLIRMSSVGCSDGFKELATTGDAVTRVAMTLSDVQKLGMGTTHRTFATSVLRQLCAKSNVTYENLVNYYTTLLCPILETGGIIRLPESYGTLAYADASSLTVKKYNAEDMLIRCVLARYYYRTLSASRAVWMPRTERSMNFATLPASVTNAGYRFFVMGADVARIFSKNVYPPGSLHPTQVKFVVSQGPFFVSDTTNKDDRPIVATPNGSLIDLSALICAAVANMDRLLITDTVVCWTPLFALRLVRRGSNCFTTITAPSRASSFIRHSTRWVPDEPSVAGISLAHTGYGGSLLRYISS